MNKNNLNFFVGLFVLIGFAALSFLTFRVSTNSFSNSARATYNLSASFNNIGSLKVDAPVKVAGFIIGRISDIYLDQKTYQVVVNMKIANEYKFSTDSAAQILTTGLLGEQYIALEPGADESHLNNNDCITLTSSALVLENLIGKFMTNIGK